MARAWAVRAAMVRAIRLAPVPETGAWGLAFAVLARLAGLHVARAAQYAANDILREAAAGQEARLLAGRAVGRFFAEALAPDLQRALVLGGPKLIAHSATWLSSTPCWRSPARCAAPWRDARRCKRLWSETLRWTASLPFQRVQHRLDLGRILGMRRQLAGCSARMLAARQIAHGAHLQRRPLALGLAAIGRAPPSFLRGPSDRCPFHHRPASSRGALAIARVRARRRATLLGRPLSGAAAARWRGARVGAAAQALRLGHGLELVIQLGAQMLGGFGGRFPARHEV